MANDETFSRAVELRDSGKFEEALECVAALETRGQRSAALWALKGHLLWELGRAQEASVEFQKSVDLAPRAVAPSLGLFHTLWDLGNRAEALEEAKRFTALTGSDEYIEIAKEINSFEEE